MDHLLKYLDLDKEGFLKNSNNWNENIAKLIAKSENINLIHEHWNILYFFRSYHQKYYTHPLIRNIIDFELENVKKNQEQKTYFFFLKKIYKLFPKGPIKQASKIAGLPNPKNCLSYRYFS